ncbi:hypothetical protein K3K67_004717, partial [Salmonella enterica subsp. enterica serovar Saintpaul]|nr:hypothetical protein [Salmonella enterica subsp. enterica serovar Saintpaul]
VRFTDVDLKANTANGSIVIYGESQGGGNIISIYDEMGSVYFGGTDTFTAKNINITGRNLKEDYRFAGGVAFYNSHVSFNGDTSVSGSGYGRGVVLGNTNHFDFIGGNASFNAKTTGAGGTDSDFGSSAVSPWNLYHDVKVYVNLTQSNFKMEADSSSTSFGQVPAFGIVDVSSRTYINGFIFQGEGDVDISGVSTDGNAVDARLFDNTALVGNFAITGTSQSGTGVYLGGQLNATLVNARITGISESGNGVTLAAKSGTVSLGNNTIIGTSETGSGIQLTGNNITLTSGTLTGT